MKLDAWIESRKVALAGARNPDAPMYLGNMAHDIDVMLRMIEAAIEGADEAGREGRLTAFSVKQTMQRVLDESEKAK